MNDKEWLDRVWKAYQVYSQDLNTVDPKLDHFVLWLYQQYGIVPPPKRVDKHE